MSTFDELVARYRNMSYGRLSGNNPSAVRSLLDEYNDRTYTQVLDPSQVTYLGDVPQNQWFYDDRNHLQFGMPGEGVQGGLIGDGTTGTTGWPTYDPYTDYGDPGYAGLIPGEGTGGVGQGLIGEQIQRGGSGEGRDQHDRMRAEQQLRSDIEQYGFQIPEKKESDLPGVFGWLEEMLTNREREARIADIMRDVKASKEFGQNKYGFDTSYKGADPEGDPSGGAEPDTGPSGKKGDKDLGKGSGSGYGKGTGKGTPGAGGPVGGPGHAGGHHW